MKKQSLAGYTMAFFLFSMLMWSSLAGASTINIYVTEAGDSVHSHQWYYGGSDWWWADDANPNVVSHSYEPGWGNSSDTFLTFSLASFSGTAADIVTASLNIDILSIWTEGRDDVGNLNAGGTVLYGNGTGWKSFDITDSIKALLNAGATTADYAFMFTGYSGFTFGSAEGDDPAFIKLVTGTIDDTHPDARALHHAPSGMRHGRTGRFRQKEDEKISRKLFAQYEGRVIKWPCLFYFRRTKPKPERPVIVS